jgi:hypothetical protein
MNRRLFFKNLLGASLITVLPVPVLNSIIKTQEKIPLKFDKDGLWLLDQNDNVIGVSNIFNVNLQLYTKPIDVTARYDKFPQYMPGLRVWSITADNMIFTNPQSLNGMIYFQSYERLKCIIKQSTMEYYGDVYLTEFLHTSPEKYYIKLEGSGELIKSEKNS